MVVNKQGGLLLELAPATSSRNGYDWTKKINFLLDATECGQLLHQVSSGVEFVHDPRPNSAQAGKLHKCMKWSVTPDKSTILVSLTSTDNTSPESSATVSIPVTWGEFIVLDSIIRFSIPKFLGMDKTFD
jgi:hypothetical protein